MLQKQFEGWDNQFKHIDDQNNKRMAYYMIQMHSPSPLLPPKITEFNYIALKQISLNLLHGLPPKKHIVNLIF